jgi:polygalacturonase
MLNSGNWNQHYQNCEDVIVHNIHVYNHSNKNNDGIDMNGCRRFILSNSIIDSDDDGIVLKSTGLTVCEDITITNCIISSYTNAIKCGTESIGGFKNITISNCVIKPTRSNVESKFGLPRSGITGISLEIVDGGVMEGVNINNIVIEETDCPIYVRLGNRGRKYKKDARVPPYGQMRNIQISDITAYNTGNFSSSITGVPGAMIENISLSNLRIINKGGVKAGEYLADYSKVKEDEKGYPQPTVWKNLPSYGFFIRHVENISLSNVTLGSIEPDSRIPVIAVDVQRLLVNNFHLSAPNGKVEFLLKDVKESKIDSKAIKYVK